MIDLTVGEWVVYLAIVWALVSVLRTLTERDELGVAMIVGFIFTVGAGLTAFGLQLIGQSGWVSSGVAVASVTIGAGMMIAILSYWHSG